MRKKYVYQHIRLDTNEVFYVGIGTPCKICNNKNGKYYYRRAYTTSGRNIFWHRVTEKTEWVYEIVKEDLSKQEADELEKELIQYHGRRWMEEESTLVNLAEGGINRKGYALSEEHKQKISKAAKGRVFSESHKTKISLALKDFYINNEPRVYTEEEKDRMSKRMKELGIHKGKDNPMYGKKHTEEVLLKMKQDPRNKGELHYSSTLVLNTLTGVYYGSISLAADSIGMPRSSLRAYLNENNNVKNKSPFIRV